MKQTLLSLLMMLLPVTVYAEEVEIDGIKYRLINKGSFAKVIQNPDGYSGDVVIPDIVNYNGIDYTVNNIDNNAFRFHSDLTSIRISNNVKNIGDEAFYWCYNLSKVIFSNSVTSIGKSAFSGCSGLTSVIIPNSVEHIGYCAFAHCTKLESVEMSNHVTSIGDQAFTGCTNLKEVVLPNSLEVIGLGTFSGCSSLTDVVIPISVSRIGFSAFKDCISLPKITIPNSVSSIEGSAFKGCKSLTTVVIGNSVGSINDYAYADCPELTDVYCYSYLYNIKSNAFDNSHIEYATLHVPASALNDYSHSFICREPWRNFKIVVAIDKQYYNLKYIIDENNYIDCWFEEGATITPEPAPSKGGYTFSGWSEIPETMPDHDVTITGTFIENTYLPGDANGDGQITVTDIGVIVDIILGKTPANARKQQEEEPQ